MKFTSLKNLYVYGSIRIKPTGYGNFHMIHYKHVTNGSEPNSIAITWHIFITLIVSCADTTVAPGNLNIISSVGIEVLLNFKKIVFCKS